MRDSRPRQGELETWSGAQEEPADLLVSRQTWEDPEETSFREFVDQMLGVRPI